MSLFSSCYGSMFGRKTANQHAAHTVLDSMAELTLQTLVEHFNTVFKPSFKDNKHLDITQRVQKFAKYLGKKANTYDTTHNAYEALSGLTFEEVESLQALLPTFNPGNCGDTSGEVRGFTKLREVDEGNYLLQKFTWKEAKQIRTLLKQHYESLANTEQEARIKYDSLVVFLRSPTNEHIHCVRTVEYALNLLESLPTSNKEINADKLQNFTKKITAFYGYTSSYRLAFADKIKSLAKNIFTQYISSQTLANIAQIGLNDAQKNTNERKKIWDNRSSLQQTLLHTFNGNIEEDDEDAVNSDDINETSFDNEEEDKDYTLPNASHMSDDILDNKYQQIYTHNGITSTWSPKTRSLSITSEDLSSKTQIGIDRISPNCNFKERLTVAAIENDMQEKNTAIAEMQSLQSDLALQLTNVNPVNPHYNTLLQETTKKFIDYFSKHSSFKLSISKTPNPYDLIEELKKYCTTNAQTKHAQYRLHTAQHALKILEAQKALISSEPKEMSVNIQNMISSMIKGHALGQNYLTVNLFQQRESGFASTISSVFKALNHADDKNKESVQKAFTKCTENLKSEEKPQKNINKSISHFTNLLSVRPAKAAYHSNHVSRYTR